MRPSLSRSSKWAVSDKCHVFPNRKHGTLVAEGHSHAARIRLDHLEGDRSLDVSKICIIAGVPWHSGNRRQKSDCNQPRN